MGWKRDGVQVKQKLTQVFFIFFNVAIPGTEKTKEHHYRDDGEEESYEGRDAKYAEGILFS